MSKQVSVDDLLARMEPLYICAHTGGLMSPTRCAEGCTGQHPMYREDALRKALKT